MIAFIRGKVFAYGIDWIILDNQGIGYRINFGHPESVKLNQEIQIFTYQHVREDELSLYGFLSLEEQELFLKLISVKGLGPRTAMAMCSKFPYTQIVQSIENGDISFLKGMPGVGNKTASQIILDLKGKLVSANKNEPVSTEIQDALEGLKSLGYKQGEIQSVANSLSERPGLSSDEYLKLGLQLLMKKKVGG
ncbi:Holliday junction branch migration protein RuvA [Anaerorhabdus furcosa]|uniref:Holliday junction branch migration complex subunit RuvA n=1 Tax=Anaerorhabdus furcosa TaxID=118967 RepID=A0A1T4Q5P0_9FIRM|nr:Holliday junction branch migration protein RuvA [Anaerorhabdus furcosa]SJZ99083.1 Holliday junction DNA helicase subunit RuvA [Anaerorhabdus furcosa]